MIGTPCFCESAKPRNSSPPGPAALALPTPPPVSSRSTSPPACRGVLTAELGRQRPFLRWNLKEEETDTGKVNGETATPRYRNGE